MELVLELRFLLYFFHSIVLVFKWTCIYLFKFLHIRTISFFLFNKLFCLVSLRIANFSSRHNLHSLILLSCFPTLSNTSYPEQFFKHFSLYNLPILYQNKQNYLCQKIRSDQYDIGLFKLEATNQIWKKFWKREHP